MSTDYSCEGIRQVRATLLGARNVPERLCGGYVYLGRYIECSTFFYVILLVVPPPQTAKGSIIRKQNIIDTDQNHINIH